MRIEKTRHLKILRMLFENKRIITSEELAGVSMASVRTVKSDIILLNEQLKNEGIAHIHARKARGYKIEAIDPEAYEAFRKKLFRMTRLFMDGSIEEMNRRLYIVQKLLGNSYVKTEIMCDELFLSRTSIAGDLAWASRFFNSFGISLSSLPGKGFCVQGREQDIRSAMAEVFCSQYQDIDPIYPVPEFDNLFFPSREIYENIRRAFFKILRESLISLTDITAKKTATQICLIRNRVENGLHPIFSNREIEDIKKTYEYNVAEELFRCDELKVYLNEIPESEVLNIARLLLAYKDVDLRNRKEREILDKNLIEENHRCYLQIYDDMFRRTVSKLIVSNAIASVREDLESIQMHIFLQKKYDYTGQDRLVQYNNPGAESVSPYAIELAKFHTYLLEEQLKIQIKGNEPQAFALIYDHALKKLPYSYTPRRLAVVSMDSRAVAEQMKQRMFDRFAKYIASIDIFNQYEMRRIDFGNYDCALITDDGSEAYNNYPITFYPYRGLDPELDKGILFDEIFLAGYNRSFLERIQQMISINVVTKNKNVSQFLEELKAKYHIGVRMEEILFDRSARETKLTVLPYYSENSGVVVSFIEQGNTEREFIDIYEFHPSIRIHLGQELRYMIFVSVRNDIEIEDIKLLNHILQFMSCDKNVMKEIVTDSRRVIDILFCKAVRDSFINE